MAQHFDVAIVGAEPAAAVAAALLCKRGRRVVLVDHGEEVTTYGRAGYRLPLRPSLIPQLDRAPAMHRVHEELGLVPELRSITRSLNPAFQTVLPHHRFDIHTDAKAMVSELSREFPHEASAVATFFERLFAADHELDTILRQFLPVVPGTLAERWRSRAWRRLGAAHAGPFEPRKWLPGVADDHPLLDVLESPLAFFGHLSAERPSTFHAVRLLARYFRGVVDFTDQVGGLPSFLLRAARRTGVEMRHHAAVASISVDGRRLRQLDIANDKQPITADYFIAGTLEPFAELLPAHAQHPRFALEEQQVRAAGALLVANLLVDRDVIPCGMGQVLLVHNGRRLARHGETIDPPMLIQRFSAGRDDPEHHGKDGGADPEREVLSVACPVRIADFAHHPDRLASMKTQILERVGRLVPFLREAVRDTSLPVDTGTWEVEDDESRRLDPWRLHPLYETTRPPLLGIAGRSPRTYFSNLWHCSHAVLPGLGIEGDYITGLAAAEGILRDAGRKWDHRR